MERSTSGNTAGGRGAPFVPFLSLFAAAVFGPGSQAFGQSATPGTTIHLDPIMIEGKADRAAAEAEIAGEKLRALPGGTALITRADMTGRADVTVADTLSTVPGVVVQSFFGGPDQPRIQIRGSGLQQDPVERGLLILQDGLPLNRADGSYVVGLADLRQAQSIEIYRGHVAGRLGGNVLGGALNLASPTGTTTPGVLAEVQGGSFGQQTVNAEAGGGSGGFDVYAQLRHSERDGFRGFNTGQRTNAALNAGVRLREDVQTRLFLGYTDLEFDVPGPLTRAALDQDPRQIFAGPTVTLPGPTLTNPGPDVVRDRPRRETRNWRAGARTTASFGEHRFDIVAGYTESDDRFIFPIAASIRDTDGADFTGVLRYAYGAAIDAGLPLLEVTAKYVSGSADRKNFQNIAGRQGALFGDSDLEATTLSLYAGMNIPLGDGFVLSPAIAFSRAARDNRDRFGTGPRPVAGFNPVTGAFTTAFALGQDTSYARSYDGWSPSLGLTYELAPRSTVFAAVSRSFEPPTHDDLLATINGSPFFSPGAPVGIVPQFAFATPDLEAQTATTIEAGWRGGHGRVSWDAVTYLSFLENELLSLRDVSGTQLASVNADETVHFGIELGLTGTITDRLSGRLAYTFQEFRFVDDAVHGDNRLAGAPRHTINTALRYALTPDWFAEAELNWRPGETPVDNANTVFNDSWATLDLRSGFALGDWVSLFGEVRNVFDTVYASSTLITDTARPDQAVFIPGEGRGFVFGLKVEL
ncbi:MAG: TonB-dependent receptor [Rhodospirillaceae bacterium]|nr:TonB-dependent receptor [Rhodospirillaceae bacterium]